MSVRSCDPALMKHQFFYHVSYDSTHLIHLCSRVHVSYGCLLKHELTCIFRVSPIETSCEKHNHPVDDEDIKKCGSSWFSCFRFFCCQKIFFADVKSEGSRYKKTSMSSTDVFISYSESSVEI